MKSFYLAAGVVVALVCTPLLSAGAAPLFSTTVLVSDQSGTGLQDTSLVNPWGISNSPSGAFRVSDNGPGVSTVYSVNPASDAATKQGLTVTIGGAGSVTGQAYNDNAAAFNGDAFLFVNEDGTISGWRPALGSSAEALALAPNAVYKGAAVATLNGSSYLYAANFASGAIDILKGNPAAPDLPASFIDPNLPAGYAPFNIVHLGNQLYVAYAEQGTNGTDEVAGAGLGFIDAFNLDGSLSARIATGGNLNAPWGLALAPSSWGALAGKLLVGNAGDGRINAYDLQTSSYVGQLMDTASNALTIDGLWALTPGNGGDAGSTERIYFTAGPNGGAHGLLGVIAPVPLPAGLPLFAAGIAALLPWSRRRQAGRA